MARKKTKVLLASMVPPRNDCGVRIVLYRHLVERAPFELHVTSQADFADDLLIHTRLELPWPVQRLRKSRFGPMFRRWIQDFENFIWPLLGSRALEQAVDKFKPDVILTLAETGLCHLAAKIAKRRGIPLAGLFLDWFPIMEPHFGHRWTQPRLSRGFRRLYRQSDLAFCTSDGMQEVLGPHPNSHVIYPMPGRHQVPETVFPKKNGKFRLVYVGAAERFYGRMLRDLMHEMERHPNLELIIVGPHQDWPEGEKQAARARGVTLGFLPPEKAAELIAGADALLVVMSFEKEHELFMRTSFTTKWLDYAAFRKPVILWGPEYCTPSRLARREDAARVVANDEAGAVIQAMKELRDDKNCRDNYAGASERMHATCFNPERLQGILAQKLEGICHR